MSDGAVRGATVRVRAVDEGDAEGLVRLYDQLAGDREEAQPAGPADARALVARLRSQPDRWLLVAESGGAVVGTADAVVVDNLTHGGRPWAVVENVVVDERWRGRGVGHALMDEVVDRARRRGCYKVQLLSRAERADAHRFYEGLGFARSSEGFRRDLR